MSRMVLWLRLLVVLPFLLSAALAVRPAFAHDYQVRDANGVWRAPVEVALSADHAPRAGEMVELLLTITPNVDLPAVDVNWSLSSGGELLGGPPTETLTNLHSGQALQFRRQVRWASEGIYLVSADARFTPTQEMPYVNSRTLFFTIKNDGSSSISLTDPTLYNPMRSLMKGEAQVVDQPIAAGTTDKVCFTFKGTITRQEMTPTTGGYVNSTVPVRFAHVQVFDEDVIWDDEMGETLTNAQGDYSIDFCEETSILEGAWEFYVELNVSLYESLDGFQVVYVEDSTGIDEMYDYQSGIYVRDTAAEITYSPELDNSQSQPFNIADAIFEAWRFWDANGGSSSVDDSNLTAEVHWEIGYIETFGGNTFYEYVNNEITIGTVIDPDAWDESSIVHEYGHLLEDQFTCDESLGGDHGALDILDDVEFAWSEGYPNYFQGAVRQNAGMPQANIYIDIQANGGVSRFDLERWDTNVPTRTVETNEMAIAALFWDLMDDAVDGQDRASYGHRTIQEVYTSEEFNEQLGDEECSVNQYFQAWQAEGKTADADTAAIITQNVSKNITFGAATNNLLAAGADFAASPATVDATPAANDYRWWKQLIMLADTSKSMEGTKLTAVKNVLTEQVNDIAANSPNGVEFALQSFTNGVVANQKLVSGKFYPEFVTPAINSLTASNAADSICPVLSLTAMAQAASQAGRGELWLFTDGDPWPNLSTETLIKSLNNRQLKGSIALLGGCNVAPINAINTSGAAKNYLGKAANASQSGGIVPYLLTAIGSGGQFLYVDQSKINDASEILRAQLSHSAGAGRWSDYVSEQPTYLYDKLNSWEYKWIDTSVAAGGVNRGVPNPQVSVALPASFPFYGNAQSNAFVTRYGYLTFGAQAQTAQSQTSALPAVAQPNNALYPLWGDLVWNNPPALVAAGANAPSALEAAVFSRQEGEWFAIETNGTIGPNQGPRAYQVLLNAVTGEIRYQYQTLLANEAGIATIGLENSTGSGAVQVSRNDTSAATNGMGYKFLPAPAQPSKTFTVTVDGLMNSVGFLLTGFSGDFDPLVVRTPDNNPVSCADSANVLCLNLGLVQYVQVKTNGRNGLWHAIVTPGPSGNGTFMFSSIGASTLTAESNSNRNVTTGAQRFDLRMGRAVTGNTMEGWFTKPNGERFGNPLTFFDDGAHNDGKAGDGRFGSDNFIPPGAGAAYLWVKGSADGQAFTRAEPTPFTFQPLEVTALGDGVNYGDVTTLVFAIQNQDTVNHCYTRAVQIPDDWTFDWHMGSQELNNGLCIQAGQTVTRALEVKMAAISPNTLPSGSSGEVIVTFVEKEEGAISDSAVASVTRRRLPAKLVILNKQVGTALRPTGVDTATLTVLVFDDQQMSVADGVEVKLSSTLGSITPNAAPTQNGRIQATFTAGNSVGDAIVTAMSGNLVATTTIPIRLPLAETLALTSALTTLPHGVNSTAITALVHDEWGVPMANQRVRMGVAGDGDLGSLNGSEVMTGTTDANGQVVATFTRGVKTGAVVVRAELVVQENNQSHGALEQAVTLIVLAAPAPTNQRVYLPVVIR